MGVRIVTKAMRNNIKESLPWSATGREPYLSGFVTGREPELSGLRERARRLSSPLVLHTDDAPQILMLGALILEHHGYRVEGALDGRRALEMAQDLRPDLILTDIMKPGLSGLELIAHLKQDPALSHVPIVVWSACASNVTIARALDAGASHYIVKPCMPEELLAVVTAALEDARARAFGAQEETPVNAR